MNQNQTPDDEFDAATLHAMWFDSDTIHVSLEGLYAQLKQHGISPSWWNEHMMKTGKMAMLCGYKIEIVVRGES